jgi:hypothetical protein
LANGGEWETHWGDPVWEAQLRQEIEAECKAENPKWEAQHAHQADAHWDAAMAVLGVEPITRE